MTHEAPSTQADPRELPDTLRRTVAEQAPRPLVTVDVDAYADMHAPGRPYRVILWEAESNLVESDREHAGRNFSRDELRALAEAALSLLNQPLPEYLEDEEEL